MDRRPDMSDTDDLNARTPLHAELTVAGNSEFGAGWTAIGTSESWLLIEPCDEPGSTRPYELPACELWCVVTSDNPYGLVRSAAENIADRARLIAVALAMGTVLETRGGVGALSDPNSWPACETGIAVAVESFAAAVKLCNEFQQAAVYLFSGDARHLVDCHGEVVLTQCYKVHRVNRLK